MERDCVSERSVTQALLLHDTDTATQRHSVRFPARVQPYANEDAPAYAGQTQSPITPTVFDTR